LKFHASPVSAMAALGAASWLLLLLAFSASCCWHAVEAKWQQSSVKFGPQDGRWQYLTKFAYGIGQGTYQFRFMCTKGGEGPYPDPMPNKTRAILELHRADNWNEVERHPKACQKKHMTNYSREVWATWGEYVGDPWSPWFNGTISQTQGTHMWFFTMSMCKDKNWNLSNLEHNMTVRMRFEFRALQADGSEFSEEYRWVPTMTAVFLVAKTILFIFMAYRCRIILKLCGEIHPVIWALITIVLTQYLSQVLHSIYIDWYHKDGFSWHKLETFSEVFEMISQVILSILIIYIALGYTLLQSKIDSGLEEVTPLSFMIGMFHVMFVGFAKIQEDGAYRTNKHNSVSGWFLVSFRVMLYLWFLWAVTSTKECTKDPKLKAFLDKFQRNGTIYFIAYPTIFLIGEFLVDPHIEQPFMTGGWMIMHMVSNIWLSSLFLFERGEYWQVSTLNANYLPGGANKLE